MPWVSDKRIAELEASMDYYKHGLYTLSNIILRRDHVDDTQVQALVSTVMAIENSVDTLQTEVDLRMKARISSILQVNSKLSKLSEALGLIWDPEKGDYVANKPKKATRKAK